MELSRNYRQENVFLQDSDLTNIVSEVNTEDQFKQKSKDSFENMLYFVCNLCPFLCTKPTTITDHLEKSHKNNTEFKQISFKCPACINIFYHKISLQFHLIYDHSVEASDVKKILHAVISYSKKNSDPKLKLASSLSETKSECVTTSKNNLNSLSGYLENSDDTQFFNSLDNFKKDVVEKNENVNLNSKIEEDKDFQIPERITVKDIVTDETSSRNDLFVLNKCKMPKCKVCLRDPAKMFYHLKCHEKDGFKCLECEQMFSFWKPLTGHLWRTHKIDMELYSCDKCEYKTFSLGKLNNIHKKIHSDAKPYICDLCSKGFKNSKQLRNHKDKHKDFLNKVMQLCTECNKMFSDRRQLRIHMDSVHKKIRPFLCSYCGYKGASKGSLKMHIRQHTGEKPFSCDHCNYSTADHNSLRRHKLRHSGQKPYKCTYCDYACIQSSTYKVHLKTKHPGLENNLLFSCSYCQFRTVNKDMYLTHISTVHKGKTILG